jgi:hypothetical protein
MKRGYIFKVLFFGNFLLTDAFQQRALVEPGWNPFQDPSLADLVRDHDLVVGSLDCSTRENANPIALANVSS